MSVWARADDTAPVLYCVAHPDCPGRRPLGPALRAAWDAAHPDAGPRTRERLRALLLAAGIPASQLDRPRRGAAPDDDDDADAPDDDARERQLPLF